MSGNILLMTPSKNTCGNFSTISRIGTHLGKNGWKCLVRDPEDFGSIQHYRDFLESEAIELVIGIHAYKTGKLIKDGHRPYLLILGGTDINKMFTEEDKRPIMMQAIENASAIVGFTGAMKEQLLQRCPGVKDETVFEIPQAVEVDPSAFKIREYIRDKHPEFSLSEDARIFVNVGGIRSVKNQLYLVTAFSDWQTNNPDKEAVLIFIGREIEKDYCKTFREEIQRSTGTLYLGELDIRDTHAVIRDSFALVNSSDSEGMSVTILEAMALGTPVIARKISGNVAIVKDGETGLLFDTPQQFIEKAELLLGDADHRLRQQITHNASANVHLRHSLEREEKEYMAVLSKIIYFNKSKQKSP